jgi:hypothetical protein
MNAKSETVIDDTAMAYFKVLSQCLPKGTDKGTLLIKLTRFPCKKNV